MSTLSPSVIGFIRGLALTALTFIVSYFASTPYAVLVSSIVLWLEGVIQTKTGNALLGSVKAP